MEMVTRKMIIGNAKAYNKYLTDEWLEDKSSSFIFAFCHPTFRETYRERAVKSGII